MKTFLRWAVGIIFLITSVSVVSSSVLAALLFLVGALVALPPVLKLIESKTGLRLPSVAKYAVVIGVLIIGNAIIFNNLSEFGQASAREKELDDSVAFANLPKAKQDSILNAKATADSLRLVAKAQKERDEKVERAFSAYDGSHRGLEKAIKKNMNDPDSYEHIETVYWDKGDHLVVHTKFRGANAFGGKVVNTLKAKADLDGNVLAIVE